MTADAPAPRLIFRSSWRTHPGEVRALNEDRFLDRSDQGLWAVADGMGGHDRGEAASALIVEALSDLGKVSSGYAYLNAVYDRLHAVNRRLVAQGRDAGGGVTGSTIVALLAHESHFACIWAGDSRAYLQRGAALERLTRDHSIVQELVDAGALTADQARRDRRANVITRAIGARPDLELDMRQGEIRAGDLFLLCSDGLTGLIDDAELRERLQRGDLDDMADDLMRLSLARGAHDNVTFVLVRAEAA